jgi:hypothetical protein
VARTDDRALADLVERMDALQSRYDDLQEQVAGLAEHGASDTALESVRRYAEGIAQRLTQLERRTP